MIQFYSEEVKMPHLALSKLKSFIRSLASEYQKKVGEIGYNFCTDERILEVNRQYLQHDYYTDILTFDYSDGECISGDIFISLDTVRSNAEKFQVEYNEELHRVIFHGILHLCGINDKSDEERANMEQCENRALQQFSVFMEKDNQLFPQED